MKLADRVAAASRAFVEGLDGDQARAALVPFDGEERRTWAYWPIRRRGVPLWTLDRSQAKAAHRLLATLLPLPAYARTVTIMNLDEVLDRLEGYRRSEWRHGGDYWVTVFGVPGGVMWAARFEGHHVSVHATFYRDEVRMTPLFLGANPAVVYDGRHLVLAPLGAEEQLGFELLNAMPKDQRATAVLSDTAPDDIVTRNLPRLDRRLLLEGVPLARIVQ